MRSFDHKKDWENVLNSEIFAMLLELHEFKGRQSKFLETKHDVLLQLVDMVKIQSTEASNKIEGIQTSNERLNALLKDKTMPKSRNECEIAGYRDVLNTIHENYTFIPINPSAIL